MDATATPPEQNPPDPFWGVPPFSESNDLPQVPGTCSCEHSSVEELVGCILDRWEQLKLC
jgi:hypothetical protein